MDNSIGIQDMIEKTSVEDNNIMIIQDNDDTKRITITNLRKGLIQDTEYPSSDRIYSSEKVNSLLQDNTDSVNQIAKDVNQNINLAMAEMKTLKKEHETITEDLNDKVPSSKIEDLLTLIDQKRPIDTLLTSSDLDTSSDNVKIGLVNLKTEVLEAMTGESPVTISKAPYGGWISSDIANNIIGSNHLTKTYRYRDHITTGNISDITDDGLFLISGTVSGLPGDYNDSSTLWLENYRFGQNGKYICQVIRYTDDDLYRPIYYRRGELKQLYSLPFITEYPINSKFKINTSHMGDIYTNRGEYNGKVFNIRSEGSYYVLKGSEDLPTEDSDYIVKVSSHDNDFVYILINIKNLTTYVALLHMNSDNVYDSPKIIKLNDNKKSRFDGTKLVILGDDYAFGVGPSNITTESYPSLLRDNYGFTIYNYALSGATAGSYDATMYEEKCVINQIETAKEKIATSNLLYIMIGSNDFKYGSCNIGSNTDLVDTTFKGSLNLIVQKIYEINPEIGIVFATPAYRARLTDSSNIIDCDSTSVNDCYLKDFANAIIDICDIYHIPVLDIYNKFGINKFNYSSYLVNGMYLNAYTQEHLSSAIYNIFNSYF